MTVRQGDSNAHPQRAFYRRPFARGHIRLRYHHPFYAGNVLGFPTTSDH